MSNRIRANPDCTIQIAFGEPIPPVGYGGVERVVEGVSSGLSRLGWTVLTIGNRGTHDRRDSGHTYVDIRTPRLRANGRFPRLIAETAFVLRALRCIHCIQQPNRIVVVQTYGEFVAIVLEIFKALLGWSCIIVFQPAGYDLLYATSTRRRLKLFPVRFLLGRVKVVAISQAVQDALIRTFSAPPKSVTLIPSAIDDKVYEHAALLKATPKRDVVLNVSRVCWRKNQLVLAKAFARIIVERPDMKLHLVGRPDGEGDQNYVTELKKYISNNNLSDRVEILGEVAASDLYAELASSKLFVFPSHVETQGLAPLEAMAFGLPVVASNIKPVVQMMDMGGKSCGVNIDPDDEVAWANAILHIINDEELAGRLSAQSLEQARRFTWDRVARQYSNLYTKLIRETENTN